jgi:hypothetical protein
MTLGCACKQSWIGHPARGNSMPWADQGILASLLVRGCGHFGGRDLHGSVLSTI